MRKNRKEEDTRLLQLIRKQRPDSLPLLIFNYLKLNWDNNLRGKTRKRNGFSISQTQNLEGSRKFKK